MILESTYNFNYILHQHLHRQGGIAVEIGERQFDVEQVFYLPAIPASFSRNIGSLYSAFAAKFGK